MAEGRGGYRQPGNPAPVSGPGALSKRTDGPQGGGGQPIRVPSGGAYGARQELENLQQAAPLSESPSGADAAMPQGDITAGLIGFGEASQQPDVPITAGAALGAGADMSSLNLPTQEGEDIQQLLTYLPVFEHMASQPGSSKAARNLVRSLKARA